MPLPLALGIGGVLAAIILPLVIRVLIGLGVGIATYTGVSLLLGSISTAIQSELNSIAISGIIELLAFMRMDDAITMIISAITIRATLAGLTAGGVIKKFSLS